MRPPVAEQEAQQPRGRVSYGSRTAYAPALQQTAGFGLCAHGYGLGTTGPNLNCSRWSPVIHQYESLPRYMTCAQCSGNSQGLRTMNP